MNINHIQLAETLWQAKINNQPCPPIRTLVGEQSLSIADAYHIQRINIDKEVTNGKRIIGHKIGLTSKAVQKQLGVDSPDFGCLLDDMILADGDSIAVSSLLQPKIEAEIAIVLKHSLEHKKTTVLDVLNAIDYVLPAIEVVASRIQNWNIKLVDTVADNASCGTMFIGTTPIDPKNVDFRNCQMTVTHNGDTVSSGIGANCLGNPLIAATWLANTMQLNGSPLQAGEIILTGALGPMVTITEAGEYIAKIDGLGEVTATFT